MGPGPQTTALSAQSAGCFCESKHARGSNPQRLLACVGRPLGYRTEVPLLRNGERPDYRAWDAMLVGHDERTGVEFELRLYDIQAQIRRHRLKWRDDAVDHFLLVVAATRANRRVLAEFADLLVGMPRLRASSVLATLRSGNHPSTGIILLDAPAPRRRSDSSE